MDHRPLSPPESNRNTKHICWCPFATIHHAISFPLFAVLPSLGQKMCRYAPVTTLLPLLALRKKYLFGYAPACDNPPSVEIRVPYLKS